jgi:copper chaperone NosL
MKKLKIYTRIVVFLCAAAMIPSNFVSVWQIQLEAPQYPEGLKMEIWSHKIAGDINKINGLNHYIGMAQIKEENFTEFKIMPWMIWAFVVIGIATAIVGRRFMLWIFTSVLVASGCWGIYDFWKWEYQYGHNLDPHAAIKIPGMAYQPPLFGWKQLLNFLAGSFPDVGGWLIIAPAVVVVAFLLFETFRKHAKHFRRA